MSDTGLEESGKLDLPTKRYTVKLEVDGHSWSDVVTTIHLWAQKLRRYEPIPMQVVSSEGICTITENPDAPTKDEYERLLADWMGATFPPSTSSETSHPKENHV